MIKRKVAERLSALFVFDELPVTENGQRIDINQEILIGDVHTSSIFWYIRYCSERCPDVFFEDAGVNEYSDALVVKDIHIESDYMCILLDEGTKIMVKIEEES